MKFICIICKQEYEASSEDQQICFPCYKAINNLREIEKDEIVFDIDSPDLHGCMCISAIGFNLFNAGYHFELWYASGQKQPHIHLKNILHIAELTDSQLRQYKRSFLEKNIPKEFWNDKIPDYSLCDKNHLIAQENRSHFKYKTLKLLRSEFNADKTNFCEKDLFEKVKQEDEYKPIPKGSGITAKIIQVINIKDVAKKYGLTLHGNKTLCPFHPDSDTESLVFYERQGRFHCFGCNADGNIIKFYAKLMEINPDFHYRRNKDDQKGV